MNLTHLDKNYAPKMVDVSDKSPTKREATACGAIKMSHKAYEMIKSNSAPKGAVLQTAIVAAIMGAKQTSNLIPMCHPLNLTSIKTDIKDIDSLPGFELFVTVGLDGVTGVEMEALTAVSVGLLTIYDMIKAVDKSMIISDIRLLKKTGGKSGEFVRGDESE